MQDVRTAAAGGNGRAGAMGNEKTGRGGEGRGGTQRSTGRDDGASFVSLATQYHQTAHS